MRAGLFLILLLLTCALSLSSCTDDEPEAVVQPPVLEPKKDVKPPEQFQGPIDPEWPPSHGQPLHVALEASRLVRARMQSGKKGQIPEINVPRSTRNLHVEAGKIGEFAYLEVIIGNLYHPDDPMPLVVLLHGRGDRPRIPHGPFSSKLPIRLFIPQAPDKLGKGYTWLATWTNSGEEQLLTRSLSARADQLAPAIEAFRRMRPTLGKPLLVGFSQGAMMSYTLATRYPKQFGAVFPMSGWLPPGLYPSPKKSDRFPYIYAQHGGADKTVPTQKDRDTVRALRARGLRVDYREDPGAGHIVTKKMDEETRKALSRIFKAYEGSVRTRQAMRGR